MPSGSPSRQSKPSGPRTGLARALSKLGFCSRSEGWKRIQEGGVKVNGRVQRDPEFPVRLGADRIEVDGAGVREASKVYLMLNKPRGLVTTASDERGRDTVFKCLEGSGLPFLGAVGRLDQASEGLLLFTNDTAWAGAITAPDSHLDKRYHVQVNLADAAGACDRLTAGVEVDGERLTAKAATVLRSGAVNSWLEITLDEGRNRQIRRMLTAQELEVLRLVRVAVGSLQLGDLPKGSWRHLTPDEVRDLLAACRAFPHRK